MLYGHVTSLVSREQSCREDELDVGLFTHSCNAEGGTFNVSFLTSTKLPLRTRNERIKQGIFFVLGVSSHFDSSKERAGHRERPA